MIADINTIREFVKTDLDYTELVERLSAIEFMIRSYTNNNFALNTFVEKEAYSHTGRIYGLDTTMFKSGDTIMVSHSIQLDGLYTIKEVGDFFLSVDPSVPYSEDRFTVHKVVYPKDVIIGCLNLLKWDVSNREKVGIKTETISRWSVTYFDMDSASEMSYPKSMIGFLKPYRKIRC